MRSAIFAAKVSTNRPYWCSLCTYDMKEIRSIGAEFARHSIGKCEKFDRCDNCTCSSSCHLSERRRAQGRVRQSVLSHGDAAANSTWEQDFYE